MAYTDNFADALISLVDDIVGAEKMELNQVLYEDAYENSNLAQEHEIITGVRTGHVIPILNNTPNPDSFPFVDETSCETEECDVGAEWSARRWELGLMECRVGICLRSFNENFLKFFNVYRQTQEGEPNLDSALLNFINDRFVSNLVIAEWRAAYFGDKTSGSALYNGIDGFFAQATANADHVVTIDENAGATFAEQAIGGEAAYNYLIEMYDRAGDYEWFDPDMMEFRVTRSMAAKIVTWLNRLGLKAPMNCECIDPNRATARPGFNIEGLTINGIPVRTYKEWDTIINHSTELNGGGGDAARVDPHRAILTFRDELLIGTSETDALQSFDIWHSKDDKKVYLEGSSYLGAAIPMNRYLVAI